MRGASATSRRLFTVMRAGSPRTSHRSRSSAVPEKSSTTEEMLGGEGGGGGGGGGGAASSPAVAEARFV